MMSAWGSEKYQLYHMREIIQGGEEIRVYYYRSEVAQARVVTELDLTQLAEVPSKTNLVYDVYKTGSSDEDYSIYVVARYEPFNGAPIKYYMYRHDIESSGNSRGFVKDQVYLGDNTCVDKVKVFDKLIVLSCKEQGQVFFIDRQRMKVLDERLELPAGEVFSVVDSFADAKTASEDSTELEFVSDYMKILARVGHFHLFLSTWDEASQVYKLRTFEIIVQDSDSEGATELRVFISPALIEVLSSQTQMQLLTLTETSVSLFFEGNARQASSLPVCYLDQSLAPDGISCRQCPLGSYGLVDQSSNCKSCAYLLG